MLVNMIVVHMVEMTIVKVIHVPIVLQGSVSAGRTMLVGMVSVMRCAASGHLGASKVDTRSIWQALSPNKLKCPASAPERLARIEVDVGSMNVGSDATSAHRCAADLEENGWQSSLLLIPASLPSGRTRSPGRSSAMGQKHA